MTRSRSAVPVDGDARAVQKDNYKEAKAGLNMCLYPSKVQKTDHMGEIRHGEF